MNPQTVRVKALLIQNQMRRINLSCVYSIAHREHLFTKAEFSSCEHFVFCQPLPYVPPSTPLRKMSNCLKTVYKESVISRIAGLVPFHQTIRRHIPEDPNLNTRYKNFSSLSRHPFCYARAG
jgi:hypothetical protein